MSEDEIHKIIEFNLTESLYYRFVVITFAIWLAIESICAFLNPGGPTYGYAVAVNGFLCLIVIVYLSLIILCVDFIFTEKVQAKKSINNKFLKLLSRILFVFYYFLTIPILIISFRLLIIFFILLALSLIYYFNRIKKLKNNC